MDMSASKRAALEAAYEPPIFVGASRQHSRAMARKAHKAATRPGRHTARHTIPKSVLALLPSGPNTRGRHVREVKAPKGRDAWFHYTKGPRSRLVAA